MTKTVAVHGTILKAECEFCGASYPFDAFTKEVRKRIKNIYDLNDPHSPKESSEIPCLECKKPGVKPATVLFGRSLPQAYFKAQKDFAEEIDLLIIMGTSLEVSPANTLPLSVRPDCVRVVINRDAVGRDVGLTTERDFFLQGELDARIIDVLTELGWLQDVWDKYGNEMCDGSKKSISDALGK